MSPTHETPLIDHAAYNFQITLTDAIAQYVQELRWMQFRALTYRGADLGRAVAVNLYFRLINDNELRSAHERYLSGESFSKDKDQIPLSTEAYWIFRQILKRRSYKYLHRRIKEYVSHSYDMKAAHLKDMGDGATAPNTDTDTIVILALSKRFFDYLLPVRRGLEANVFWLVPEGSDLAVEIAAEGENILLFKENPGRQPSAPLSAALAAHWTIFAARFDEFRKILDAVKPQAVVIPEGNQTNDEILARAAQSAGVRSICIQQGWSPIVHAGFRAMRYDAFCVWGPEFARLLQPYNHKQAFVVTGSHQIGPAPKERMGNKSAISFFLQNNTPLITPRAWNEMLLFIAWVARTWPDRRILVRQHPTSPLTSSESELLAQMPNIFLCPAAAISLGDVLQQTGIAVAFYSTTLVEALACGAIPLIINITGAPRYNPDLEALGVGLEVHDFDAAREAMSQLLEETREDLHCRIASIVPRFFAYPVGAALRNIDAAIAPGR